MKINLKGAGGYLRLPIQTDKRAIKVVILESNKEKAALSVNLAGERIDYWNNFYLNREAGQETITVDMDADPKRFFNAVKLSDGSEVYDWEKPVFHFSGMGGYLGSIEKLCHDKVWKMTYRCNPFGLNESSTIQETVLGDTLFALEKEILGSAVQDRETEIETETAPELLPASMEDTAYFGGGLTGDISEIYVFSAEDRHILIGRSTEFFCGKNRYRQVYTSPFQIMKGSEANGMIPADGLQKLRMWKREWHVKTPIRESLSFRVIPSKWPNICVVPSDGGIGDITAKAFEIHICFRLMQAWKIEVMAAGIHFIWDRRKGLLQCGNYEIPAGTESELEVTILSDYGCGEILCNGQAVFVIKQDHTDRYRQVDNEVSGNLEKCRLMEKETPEITIISQNGEEVYADITAYGIRKGTYSEKAKQQIMQVFQDEEILYKSETYRIYKHHVSDQHYGAPDAWAVSSTLVYSPVRVMEEFAWRNTPWGDMVRIIERGECFRPDIEIQSYASFHTGLPVLDAAYNIALDTFVKCKSSRFALEGQTGLWSAGLFQGEKEGFGVWLRDSSHVALRGGNLIDPEAAGKTLLYALHNGFDNGSDGSAMAACGIWDYYKVTGDAGVVFEAWDTLKQKIKAADTSYVEAEGLVKADQSTSNDALPEPENNGYCLGTECYYMLAYESMYHMGCIVGEKKQNLKHWKNRAETMRAAIQEKYWNEQYGYFTSGPKGSEAYEKGLWETSGEEAAIWSRFGIATEEQRKEVLKNVEKAAMCEYGIVLFPNKNMQNHFCGSVWTVWEAGFAAAAAECKDTELVWKLIAQQLRNCMMNKTFYEVIDKENGMAWRWPGQLWHAAGFLSLILYGIMGIEYTEEGLYFHPCVPAQLPSISADGFRYGKAVFHIRIEGSGNEFVLFLDGICSDKIRSDIDGKHEIFLQKV